MSEYPSLLRPTATETLIIAGQPTAIPKAQLTFRQWKGAPLSDTLGKKPLVNFAGRPLFAELCVFELFRLSGWDARWVETYGAPAARPSMFTNWSDVPRKQQQHQPLTDAWIIDLLASIAALNNGSHGGCWDVLGWHGETVVFAELKRLKKDRLQATQPAWLEAGLKVGLQAENFLLVEWDFIK